MSNFFKDHTPLPQDFYEQPTLELSKALLAVF